MRCRRGSAYIAGPLEPSAHAADFVLRSETTDLLSNLDSGDSASLERLVPLLYEQLRCTPCRPLRWSTRRTLKLVDNRRVLQRGRAPVATTEIHLHEYGYAVPRPIRPGSHVVRVVNEGAEDHELIIAKLGPGQTIEDIYAWLENPAEVDTGSDQLGSSTNGLVSLAPGREAEFTAGDYLLICFVTGPGGKSHIAHGMVQQIRIG